MSDTTPVDRLPTGQPPEPAATVVADRTGGIIHPPSRQSMAAAIRAQSQADHARYLDKIAESQAAANLLTAQCLGYAAIILVVGLLCALIVALNKQDGKDALASICTLLGLTVGYLFASKTKQPSAPKPPKTTP